VISVLVTFSVDVSAAFLDFSPPEKIGDRNYIKVRFQPTGTKPLNESAIIETVKGVMELYVTDAHCRASLEFISTSALTLVPSIHFLTGLL